MSTFRGANVADKPSTLMRNEDWMQKMFEGKAPTVGEAMSMKGFYFRHVYGNYPHAGIGSRKPYEVFSSAPVPDDRRVKPTRLHYLMLAVMNRLAYRAHTRPSRPFTGGAERRRRLWDKEIEG